MHSAMESMDGVGWMILDRSKYIIKRNALYQQMFNIPEEILLNDMFSINNNWVKNLMSEPEKFMQSSLDLPLQEKKAVHEFQLIDGRRIRRVSSPFFDENEELMGWNIIIFDITNQKTV